MLFKIEESIARENSGFESVLDAFFDDSVRGRVEKVMPESFEEADEKNIEKIISINPYLYICSLQALFYGLRLKR